MSGPGLEELFDRYRKAGDLAALAEVFDRTADQLLKIAWHLSHDEAQAEDLVQSTFLAAIEHPERFDASREFVPWLVGILTNKAQVARTLAARTPDPERLAERSAEDPVDDSERRELMAKLEGAIERVPDAYRQVLRIHLAEGKEAEEIAHEVKRPAGTVRVQLHRGLKHLRKYLPAGFALGGIVVLSAPRGLAAMRAHVLGRASVLAKAGAAGVAGVSTAQIVGGVLVGKKIAAAAAILIVASGALWMAKRDTTHAESASVVTTSERAQLETSDPSDVKLADAGTAQRETVQPAASTAHDDPYGSLDMEWTWTDGTRAVGIAVEAVPMGEGSPYDHAPFEFTDEHGHLSFEHLHEGKVAVLCDRKGSTPMFETSVARGQRTSATFVVPAGEDVRGRVVDQDGNPVAGAAVWLSSSIQEGGSIAARTAADGSYSIRALDPSRCLFATADRLGSSLLLKLQELDQQGTGAITLDLPLRGESGAVEGIVRDPEGNPITGAWLKIRCANSAQDGKKIEWPAVWMATPASGEFRFTGLHAGAAEVEAYTPGFAVWVGHCLIEEGGMARVEARLEKGFTVEGTVRSTNGAAVAFADVSHGPRPTSMEYVWRRQLSTRTGEDGRYRLAFVPSGTVQLSVASRSAEAVSRAATQMSGRSGDVLTWDPVLQAIVRPNGKIIGRVVDESGSPLEGWSVETGTRGQLDFSPSSVKTDARGRFEISGCADVRFRVAAYAPHEPSRFAPQAGALLDGVRPGEGELLLTVTSTSRPSAYLRAKLVDEQGKPVGEAVISAWNEGTQQSSCAITGKGDGSFEVGPMPSGTYTVHVIRGKLPTFIFDPIEVAPDERRDLGTIAIKARGRCEITLHREDGASVENPFMLLFKGRYASFLGSSDGQTFVAEDLYPGTYRFFPVGQNVATEQCAVEISSGETTRREFRLRAGVLQDFAFLPPGSEDAPQELRIVIHDANGSVLLESSSGMNSSSDGTFTLSFQAGFAPGRYSYEATAKGWKATGSFEIADLTTKPATIHAHLVHTH